MNTAVTPLSLLSQADAQWLSGVLEGGGHLTAGNVTAVAHDVIKKSKYLDVARLRISYSADAATAGSGTPPAALMLKFGKPVAGTPRSLAFARKELAFYTQVAPAMKNPPTARCYGTAFDEDSGRYHFLLEDLSASHAHVNNPLPPSVRDCEAIFECLARFHAAWWNDARVGKTLGEPYAKQRSTRRLANIAPRTTRFLAFLGDRLTGARRATLQEQCAAYPLIVKQQQSRPLTITHGDAHYQNFMLTPDGGDCRIIDWEDWELAPASDDLAYMLAVLWFPEQRQRLELPLLQRYHRALVAAGVPDYPWEALWNDYRLSVVKHLVTPTYLWATGAPALVWWNHFHRVFAAFEDLHCAEVLGALMREQREPQE